MFGRHKAKREKRKIKAEREHFDQEKKNYEENNPQREREMAQLHDEQREKKINQARTDRTQARQEGRAYAKDVLSQDVQGLDPNKRKALQYEAQRNIDRDMQSANRKLLGEQSRRGIVGKGGVGYAQQRDLQRMGMESKNQVDRDLTKLDADLALKKLGSMFSVESGEAAQSQLDRQMAEDELGLAEEKKRQRNYENQINRLFSRL